LALVLAEVLVVVDPVGTALELPDGFGQGGGGRLAAAARFGWRAGVAFVRAEGELGQERVVVVVGGHGGVIGLKWRRFYERD